MPNLTLSDSAFIISESERENTVFKLTFDENDEIASPNFEIFFIKGVDGHGQPDVKTREKAAALYKQAGLQGHTRALLNLGWLYQVGVAGTELHQTERDKEAARYYKLAVELGVAAAMTNLGLLYMQGRAGTELPDQVARDKEAVEYYKRAMEFGRTAAVDNLYTLCSYNNRLPLAIKTDIARCFAKALSLTDPMGSTARTALQNLAGRNKEHTGIEYWTRFLLPENQRAAVITSLLAKDPAAIFDCLLNDHSIDLDEKTKYVNYIEANHISRLSPEQISRLALRNELLALRITPAGRNCFFSRVPEDVMKMIANMAMPLLGNKKI